MLCSPSNYLSSNYLTDDPMTINAPAAIALVFR